MNKKSKTIKIIMLIFIFIVIFICLWLSHCYAFFKYGFSSNAEKSKVHYIVCKNLDIRYQQLKNIIVTDNAITVNIKNHTFSYFFGNTKEREAVNFDTMMKIYNDMPAYGKNRGVGIGAVGSSDYDFLLWKDNLEINKSGSSGLSMNYLFGRILEYDNIKGITVGSFNEEKDIEMIDTFPTNSSIKNFDCSYKYSSTKNIISKLTGLENLDLYLYDGNIEEEDSIYDISYLNDLNYLKDITMRADIDRIDLTGVLNSNVEKVTLYTTEIKPEKEKELSSIFPNAEIEIILS